MALWTTTPRDEGFQAFGMAMPRCMNTYPPNTSEHAGWNEGWDHAHMQNERQSMDFQKYPE